MHYRSILLALALTLGLVLACNEPDDATVLECSGQCECDPEDNSCTCLGGTDCAVAGEEPGITLICEGNARCELACGPECTVECPGTAGCDAHMGPDSSAVCNGTGSCAFTCDGDCSIDCPGASNCTVACPVDASCEITSCGQGPEDCGDGVLACRTACPG